MGGRRGHFRAEIGLPRRALAGSRPALCLGPTRVRPYVEALADKLRQQKVEAVCGPLVGGAYLAQAVAARLDVELYYTERFAPEHPGDSLYPVEYRLPGGVAGRVRGKAVAMVDDAKCGVRDTRRRWRRCRPTGHERSPWARYWCWAKRPGAIVTSRALRSNPWPRIPYELWRPADCPLCAAGEPLEDRTGAG